MPSEREIREKALDICLSHFNDKAKKHIDIGDMVDILVDFYKTMCNNFKSPTERERLIELLTDFIKGQNYDEHLTTGEIIEKFVNEFLTQNK